MEKPSPRLLGFLNLVINHYSQLAEPSAEASLIAISVKADPLPPIERNKYFTWLGIDWDSLGPRAERKQSMNKAPLALIPQLLVLQIDAVKVACPSLYKELLPFQDLILHWTNSTTPYIPTNLTEAQYNAYQACIMRCYRVWNRNAALRNHCIQFFNNLFKVESASSASIARWRSEKVLSTAHVTALKMGKLLTWTTPSLEQTVFSPDLLILPEHVYSMSEEWLNIGTGYRNGVWLLKNYVVMDSIAMIRDALLSGHITPYTPKLLSSYYKIVNPHTMTNAAIIAAKEVSLQEAVADCKPYLQDYIHHTLKQVRPNTRITAKAELETVRSAHPNYLVPGLPESTDVYTSEIYWTFNRDEFLKALSRYSIYLEPRAKDNPLFRRKRREYATMTLPIPSCTAAVTGGAMHVNVLFKRKLLVDVTYLKIQRIIVNRMGLRISRIADVYYMAFGDLYAYAGSDDIDPAVRDELLSVLLPALRKEIVKAGIDDEKGWKNSIKEIKQKSRTGRERGCPPFTQEIDEVILAKCTRYTRAAVYDDILKQFPQYLKQHIRLRAKFLRDATRKGLTLQDLRDKEKVNTTFLKRELAEHADVMESV
jgi:hypothetical protein